jgi:hypothetical protein
VGWTPAVPAPGDDAAERDGNRIFSLRRDHGVKGAFRLHNQNDEINDRRGTLEKVIIEYRIEGISYDMFTVRDLLTAEYAFDASGEGNITGDIAERIARRVTKYWLKHNSIHGKTGGIFDRRFNPRERDDFIIANTQQYILKIRKYPNLVILEKTGRGKYGYENIKEIDGLFDYRYFRLRNILVLESKLEKLSINCDDLLDNCFVPLSNLFPDAHFSYVLFTDRNSIYQKRQFERRRQIKQFPYRIYSRLKEHGVATLFFSFNEARDDFERMKDHLITQYRAVNRMGVTLKGRTVITDRELTVFDGGETPHLKLVKDARTGLWREVKFTHKNRS